MEALEILKLYKEQQDAGDLTLLETLKRHSKVMLKRCIDGEGNYFLFYIDRLALRPPPALWALGHF